MGNWAVSQKREKMAESENEQISFLEYIEREEECYNRMAFILGAGFMLAFWKVYNLIYNFKN